MIGDPSLKWTSQITFAVFGLPRHPAQAGEIREQVGIAVIDLLVQPGAGDDVGGGIEPEDAAIHVEALARIALHRLQRHQLGARNAVQIGQLETQEFDPVALQLGDRLGNIVLGFSHEETPRCRERPIDRGGKLARQILRLQQNCCHLPGTLSCASRGEQAMRLKGKRAFISGAGSGIGEATALKFAARRGARHRRRHPPRRGRSDRTEDHAGRRRGRGRDRRHRRSRSCQAHDRQGRRGTRRPRHHVQQCRHRSGRRQRAGRYAAGDLGQDHRRQPDRRVSRLQIRHSPSAEGGRRRGGEQRLGGGAGGFSLSAARLYGRQGRRAVHDPRTRHHVRAQDAALQRGVPRSGEHHHGEGLHHGRSELGIAPALYAHGPHRHGRRNGQSRRLPRLRRSLLHHRCAPMRPMAAFPPPMSIPR